MLHKSRFVFLHDDQQEESTTSTPGNVANSPLSDDEIKVQLHKKRRGVHKRVVTVSIGGGDDPRSKAEIHPPKDSWSWRKYGQKPIKGSPYPRGYYRCSSSKGCPAKKQVERSCLDPNILLITYSGEHNHSHQSSTTTKLPRIHQYSPVSTTTTPVSPIPTVTLNPASSLSNASDVPSTLSQDEETIAAHDINNFPELTGESGWFSSDMGTAFLDDPPLVCPAWADVDVDIMLPIGEEDQSLFGDLGELPESSIVFRRGVTEET